MNVSWKNLTVGATLALAGVGLSTRGCFREADPSTPLVETDLDPKFEALRVACRKQGAQVSCYPVPSSKYTLIHVEQNHSGPAMLNGKSKLPFIRWQQDVANNIVAAASTPNFPVLGIYPEGVSVQTLDKYKKALTVYDIDANRRDAHFDAMVLVSVAEPAVASKAGSLLGVIKTGTPLYAAEKIDLNQRAIKAVSSSSPDLHDIQEEREDFVLFRVNEDFNGQAATALTVFGAQHDFRDNIAKWNQKHPDRKFSLIVVQPKSVAEFNAR